MEEVIHSLCMAQLEAGLTPTVLAPKVRGQSNRLDVPYKVLRFARPSSKRFLTSQLLLPLFMQYWRTHFDVLHCHTCHPPGTVAGLFRRLTHVPVVLTSHGGDIAYDEPGVIGTPAITASIRRNLSTASAVTAISADMERQLLTLGARERALYRIPNGVWVNDFRPGQPYQERMQTNETYILFLGRLIERKGVDLLLEAFSRLCSEFPTVRLKIAGTGKAEDALRSLSSELGISERVDFLGTVRGQQKIDLFQQARFAVFPSRYEPFGVVVLEAMASGIPVVAADVGGIPDMICDGDNGVLFARENVPHLVENCCELLSDLEKADALVASGNRAVRAYDWPVIARRYADVYAAVTEGGTGRKPPSTPDADGGAWVDPQRRMGAM